MRDRLIELIRSVPKINFPIGSRAQGKTYQTAANFADHLLANGVIVPPCKVGTVVYVLRSQTSNGKNLYLREERIDHYRTFGERSFMCFESGRLSVSSDQWDRDVFLTPEEAEKALAERSAE